MAERLQGMVWAKRIWLETVGSKRSDMDRTLKLREMQALEQAVSDYSAAAKRDAA